MLKRIRGVAVLGPLALVACGRGGSVAVKADTLQYAVKHVTKSDGECRSTDSLKTPSPCVKLDITWPELSDATPGGEAARQFIRRLASASFRDGADKGSPDSVAAEALAGHAEMRQKHAGYNVPWTMERQVTVACNEPGRFGVKVYSNQFTGGLHAASATRYANFDTRTGKRWNVAELVPAGQERGFKEKMLHALQKDRTVEQIKVDIDSFPMPTSVLACGDSVLVHYDLLNLGPHRMTDKVLTVKRDSLKGVIQP